MTNILKAMPACIMIFICGCSGISLENESLTKIQAKSFDGAFLSYFLPRGEMEIVAKYSKEKGTLTITHPESAKIVADYDKSYQLKYAHASLSNDEIDVSIDSLGLLTKISSTSSDQTVALVTSVNEVISQVGAFKGAIESERASDNEEAEVLEKSTPTPQGPLTLADKCPSDLEAVLNVEFDHASLADRSTKEGDYKPTARNRAWTDPAKRTPGDNRKNVANCMLELTIVGKVKMRSMLSANVFANPPEPKDSGSPCRYKGVVCFRIPGTYEFKVAAQLKVATGDNEGEAIKVGDQALKVMSKIQTLAPIESPMGYARFNRRNFVENSTTLTFTNGMLTGVASKDPSEVVGFFSLPLEILKSTTILVEL